MHTKKVKTTVIENFTYDDSGINIEPALLLKLLEFAQKESNSEENLYSIVAKSQLLAETTSTLLYDHYDDLISTTKTIENPTYVEGAIENVDEKPVNQEVSGVVPQVVAPQPETLQ